MQPSVLKFLPTKLWAVINTINECHILNTIQLIQTERVWNDEYARDLPYIVV